MKSCVLMPTFHTSWASQGAAKAVDWPRSAQYYLVPGIYLVRDLSAMFLHDGVCTTYQLVVHIYSRANI